MIISLGTSAYDNRVRQKKLSVDQLYDMLAEEPVIRKDKDGPYFIMASFEGNKRRASAVKEYFGATIDLDDTSLTLEEVQETFEEYSHVIYTTHNHILKGNRYRLVLPYKKPVSPEQHVVAMLVLMHELGFDDVDTSSKALARPMYLPSCNRKYADKAEFIENKEDKFYDASKAEISADLEWEMAQNTTMKERFDPNESYSEGGRNEALTRLVGKFIHNGMDLNTCLTSSKAWSDANCTPPLNDNELETIVNSVYNSHKRNNKDAGWGVDELVRRIKTADKLDENVGIYVDLIANSHHKLSSVEQQQVVKLLSTKSKISATAIKKDIHEKVTESKKEYQEEKSNDTELDKLKKFFDNYVYITGEGRILNTTNGTEKSKDDFNVIYNGYASKGTILSNLTKFHCLTMVDHMMFNPQKKMIFESEKVRYVNSYVKPDIKGRKGPVKPMLRHFKYLIKDSEERNMLLDYIAFLIQYPGVKVSWMPVIKGGKGIGKSFIQKYILSPLLGKRNVRGVGESDIKDSSGFNEWQLNIQLVVFHELYMGASYKEKMRVANQLKSFITEDSILANFKGKSKIQIDNCANSIAFTNHDDVLAMEDQERRYLMLRSFAVKKNTSYYARLAKWCNANKREMYYFFKKRDISKFDSGVPMETNWSRELKNESLPFPLTHVRDALGEDNSPFKQFKAMTYTQIVDWTVQFATNNEDLHQIDKIRSSGNRWFPTGLKELGFKKWDGNSSSRVTFKGHKQSVWLPPSSKKPLSAGDITEILKTVPTVWEFEDD